MSRPKYLKKPPLVESTFSIRFSINEDFPSDMVPGIFFSSLKDLSITDIQKLPILELPESVRNSDQNLQFAPYYTARYGNVVLNLGPRVIAISSPMPYIGWEDFSSKIDKILESIFSNSEVVKNVLYVGIKNLNFFESDILSKSNLAIENPIAYNKEQYNYTDVYKNEDLIIRSSIANGANMKRTEATDSEKPIVVEKKGSTLILESSINSEQAQDFDTVIKFKERVHLEAKNVFFDFLKQEFLDDELGAVYE